jgi:glucokinase
MKSRTLLADIGGSKSRFALAGPDGSPIRIQVIDNDSVSGVEAAIAHYCDGIEQSPEAAVLAVAGPIDGDEVALTNRPWRFRRDALAGRFGFAQLAIINDYEAASWSLAGLGASDTIPLGPALAIGPGTKVAIGPGTGLGVGALIRSDGKWHAVASEGGHASFGPQSGDEFDVFRRLGERHGLVQAETILSGPGLVRLAWAIDPQSPVRAPEAIVTAALAGEPSALATVQLFVRLLGRFAGGLALTFKALGGVYVCGSVAAGLGPLLHGSQFRDAFERHPPYEELMRGIATLRVTCAEPGLIGCAVLAGRIAAEGQA